MTTTPANHHRYLSDDDEHEKYASVGVDGLLAATEKILAVNRGLADPDDRDSLPNDRIHTVDRLMAERVKLDHNKTLRAMMGRVSRTRNLSPMGADSFGAYTTGYLTGNPLVTALEEINPMHILEQKRRITKMGPGGIGDPNAITADMQSISGSQFGFIDTIAGPECFDAKTEVYTKRGWVAWPLVFEEDMFACNIGGELEFLKAERLVRSEYSGEMLTAHNPNIRMCVTESHRIVISGKGFCSAGAVYGCGIDVPSGIKIPSHNDTDPCVIKIGADEWGTSHYAGVVYCATVSGGQLYVRGSRSHVGFWSGNSDRAGIDVRMATGTRIGSDGRIYQLLRNRRTGKNQWVSPTDMVGKTLKLPD
jgi:hypothetical protein